MPEKKTLEAVERDREQGKAPSTQAGEFVREEIEHVREGKHGARSAKQAIAIGLSKARRAGVELPAPSARRTSPETRRRAKRDLRKAGKRQRPSKNRSRAVKRALSREGRSAASRGALAKQGRGAARSRGRRARSQAAKKAVRTKGPSRRSSAAKKAARTRARR